MYVLVLLVLVKPGILTDQTALLTSLLVVGISNGVFLVITVLLRQIPAAALAAINILKGNLRQEVEITIVISILLCYLISSFAYFKVIQHQRQVQGNHYILFKTLLNLKKKSAKHKKTVVTILYILALVSISILPIALFRLRCLLTKGLTCRCCQHFTCSWCFSVILIY